MSNYSTPHTQVNSAPVGAANRIAVQMAIHAAQMVSQGWTRGRILAVLGHRAPAGVDVAAIVAAAWKRYEPVEDWR